MPTSLVANSIWIWLEWRPLERQSGHTMRPHTMSNPIAKALPGFAADRADFVRPLQASKLRMPWGWI